MNQRSQKIQSNLANIKNNISKFKTVDEVCLVAVTKYGDYDDVKIMYDLGHRDFGENRIEELEKKSKIAQTLGHHDIRWHFIGNIQSNKVKRITGVSNLYAIHSVENTGQLKKLIQYKNSSFKIFIQVNTTHEEQKNGLKDYSELQTFFDGASDNLSQLSGLMTMGSQLAGFDNEKCFKTLFDYKLNLEKSLAVNLSLSMGMSGDYISALENGADYLRIGSILFK